MPYYDIFPEGILWTAVKLTTYSQAAQRKNWYGLQSGRDNYFC